MRDHRCLSSWEVLELKRAILLACCYIEEFTRQLLTVRQSRAIDSSPHTTAIQRTNTFFHSCDELVGQEFLHAESILKEINLILPFSKEDTLYISEAFEL
ncbi:hypothetical protein WICPIJ_001135 [Wickerhamomyces pijperi]|uniref:Uncharacterized protein n=1 Tax=Wickerhamomyces pijperi TaxID=599730 RepID=A0A9P8QEA7_WICPI|nr:hypothetical protein WICPIJ_001135 [Wickerhamomyces pijperi]